MNEAHIKILKKCLDAMILAKDTIGDIGFYEYIDVYNNLRESIIEMKILMNEEKED